MDTAKWTEIVDQLPIDKVSKELWFTSTDATVDRSVLVIKCPNRFCAEKLKNEYTPPILKTASSVLNAPLESVEFVIEPPKKEEPAPLSPSKENRIPVRMKLANLNSEYTLENFIAGESNRVAYFEAQNIISQLGRDNPCLIYADNGLGKTHLLHAIGNKLLETSPEISVLYFPMTKFLNQFVHSIQENTTQQFQEYYRKRDVLLIDDIQLIGGKDKTQGEFFDLFNEFHLAKRQMVFTSDRHPLDLEAIANRIKSRMLGGVIIPIYPPERELRIKILQRELAGVERYVDNLNMYIQLIANEVVRDIRQLKAAALSFKREIESGKEVSLDLLKGILKKETFAEAPVAEDTLPKKAQQVITCVANYFALDKEVFFAKDRDPRHDHARQICFYLLCELGIGSIRKVASLFNRNPSSVLRAYQKITSQKDTAEVHNEVEAIMKQVASM